MLVRNVFDIRCLIPLYAWPLDKGIEAWENAMWCAYYHPGGVGIIVNPNSGPAGIDTPEYRYALNKLRKQNVLILGYVATDYGDRPARNVQRDMYAYMHAGIDDIFFDEVSALPRHKAYYASLCKLADFTIVNPGRGVPTGNPLYKMAKYVVTFDDPASKWMKQAGPGNRCAIFSDVRTPSAGQRMFNVAAENGIYVAYCTPGREPEPFDIVPLWLKDINFPAFKRPGGAA